MKCCCVEMQKKTRGYLIHLQKIKPKVKKKVKEKCCFINHKRKEKWPQLSRYRMGEAKGVTTSLILLVLVSFLQNYSMNLIVSRSLFQLSKSVNFYLNVKQQGTSFTEPISRESNLKKRLNVLIGLAIFLKWGVKTYSA